MTAIVTSIGLKGLEGYRIRVEVQAVQGLESIIIVGLPDVSVKESKQRISAALHSSGYSLMGQKIKINLAPSELKKNGPLYDLPMAIGILKGINILNIPVPDEFGFVGALSLDGTIQSARGMLPAILAAKRLGLKRLYCPYDETLPSINFDELEMVYVNSLQEVVQHLSGQRTLPPLPIKVVEEESLDSKLIDFHKIMGHSTAKHAFEVAAAGEHHIFLTGPPGCGKSLLAESFPSILPPLSREGQIEMISIYQLNGATIQDSRFPPYRNPHHSASGVSIIGGGQNPKPGEISLAHRGVLFLDEMAEFTKKTLEMLRQPLESGDVTISRVHSTVSYPASFILVGAMNPCPCGYLESNSHYCTCSQKQIHTYQNKLSGPIRDRFDIFLKMRPVNLSGTSFTNQETSASIRKRVIEARNRQYNRYGKEICNSRVTYETLINDHPITDRQLRELQHLSFKHNWSNRVQIKLIRLARTLADMQGKNKIADYHLSEAIKLRRGLTLLR